MYKSRIDLDEVLSKFADKIDTYSKATNVSDPKESFVCVNEFEKHVQVTLNSLP